MRRIWIAVAAHGLALAVVFTISCFVLDDADNGSVVTIERQLADMGRELSSSSQVEGISLAELKERINELTVLAEALKGERIKTDRMLETGIYRKLTWFLLIVASAGLGAYVWLLLSFRSTQIQATRSTLWSLLRRTVVLHLGFRMPPKANQAHTAEVVRIVGVTRWHLEQSLQALTALEVKFPAEPGTDAEMLILVIKRLVAATAHHFIPAVDPQSTEWSALGEAQRALQQQRLEMEQSIEHMRASIDQEVQKRLEQRLAATDLQNRDAAKALVAAEEAAARTRREANERLAELRNEHALLNEARAAAEKTLQDAEVQRTASTREKQQAEEALRAAKEAVATNELLLRQVQACVDFTAERLLEEALEQPLARELILRALQPLFQA